MNVNQIGSSLINLNWLYKKISSPAENRQNCKNVCQQVEYQNSSVLSIMQLLSSKHSERVHIHSPLK